MQEGSTWSEYAEYARASLTLARILLLFIAAHRNASREESSKRPAGVGVHAGTASQRRRGVASLLAPNPLRPHFTAGPNSLQPKWLFGCRPRSNRASSGSATQPNRGNPMCVGSYGAATCEAVIPTTPPADASGLPEPASDMFRGGAARLGRLAHHPHRFMLCSSPMYVGCVLNLSKSAAPCPPSSAI